MVNQQDNEAMYRSGQTQDDGPTNMILKELSFQIMAAAFEVHNTLGYGFLESVYEKALMKEFRMRGIFAESQKTITVFYKGEEVGSYCADIVVDSKIILELKAVEFLNRAHEAQLLNYLKGTGFKLGILINFGKERVDSKRLVL